jgi:hypothetical protein
MKRLFVLATFISAALLLSACNGLGGEPPVVATIGMSATQPTFDATMLAQIHAQVTPSGSTAMPQGTPAAAAPIEVLGTVSGQVTNATFNAKLPAALEVELHSVDRAFNDTVLTTKPDAEGKFTFSDVPIRADRSYFAAAVIEGRYFASEPVVGNPALPTINLPFKIYERTDDPSVLNVANVMTQVSPDEGGLYVIQIIRFENTSDRIYSTTEQIGEDRYASVRVALPEGAVLLGFATDEARYHVEEGIITDTQPVYPAARHIVHFRYLLPYQQSGTRITLPLAYRTEGSVLLLVNPASLSVSAKAGDQTLPAQSTQELGGSPYLAYGSSLQLPADTTLTYTISGEMVLPRTVEAPSVGISMQPFAIGLIVGGLLMIGVGVVLMVRGRKTTVPAADLAAEQERLIAALAALDEQHKQGEVGKAAYTRQRDSLKAQLAKLMGGKQG